MWLVDTAVFLAAAVIAVPLFQRVGLGTVLGYLTAGVLIGPSGLGLIEQVEGTLHIAEFGVVLLLFLIGLELQPARLWAMRGAVFGFGGAQVALSAALLTGGGIAFGLPLPAAAVIALALSLSSTAFVLQLLSERHELTTSHGRAAFGILLFQDLAAIPILAIVPLLGASAATTTQSTPLRIAVVVAVLAGIFIAGRFLLRPVFRIVAQTRSRELSAAWALLVVVATALAMEQAGLSMALGAFLAGVLLADSEYRHEAEANIEPFKGLLLGLFFIAVGMSADLGVVVEQPAVVLGVALGVVVIKAVVLGLLGHVFSLRADGARKVALSLSQGGEFAFVIFGVAQHAGVLTPAVTEVLIVVVTLSMATTPALLACNDALLRRRRAEAQPFDEISAEDGTVIIAGFGRFGQIISRILTWKRIPTTALELDPTQIEVIRRFGHKIFYGDAARIDLLHAAGAARARLFILAIDDVEASVRTARVVRENFPDLRIVARARNRQHAHTLMKLGVSYVIRETFVSSLEAGARVLEELGLSGDQARQAARRFRQHDETLLEHERAADGDEATLMAMSRDAAAELEQLLTEDDRGVA